MGSSISSYYDRIEEHKYLCKKHNVKMFGEPGDNHLTYLKIALSENKPLSWAEEQCKLGIEKHELKEKIKSKLFGINNLGVLKAISLFIDTFKDKEE